MNVKAVSMAKSLILGYILIVCVYESFGDSYQSKIGVNESTRIFSPRMDYDEWTPLGRGDPLKNDPTFDYVPPVLDRVQYWLGESQTTEPSSKRDVLVLGVTAKKTSPQIPEHFLKFMDTQQKSYMTRDFTGSTGAEPPKLIRNTKFRSVPPGDFKHSNKPHYGSYAEPSEFFYSDNQKPYTMMLPPPLNSVPNALHFGPPQNVANKQNYAPADASTTSSSVTFEKSNLLYHQSSHQTLDWPSASPLLASNHHNRPKDTFEGDHHHSASMNHEIIIGPNANIIVDASDNTEDKGEIVMGLKSPDVNMSVIMANASTTSGDYESKGNVTVSIVMPTNYRDTTKSISGTRPHVTAAPASVASSTAFAMSATTPFVSSTTMLPIIMSVDPDMAWQQDQAPPPMFPVRTPPKVFRRPMRPFFGPRPIMFSPDGFRPTTVRSVLGNLLQKETHKGFRPTTTTSSSTTARATTTTSTTTSTVPPPTTPVSDSFTTDPIFSHYKQPSAPLQGPMYLIIQGHSKVKTYKPTVNKHAIPAPIETTSRPISEFEQFVNENTRRVTKTTTEKIVVKEQSGVDSLVNLVEKGVSAFGAFEDKQV